MSRASAARSFPGARVEEVERLWCDPRLWPGFVDGLAGVGSADPAYPEAGSVVEWHSYPGGRGEVREMVLAYVPGRYVASQVDDEPTTARQVVTFTDGPNGAGISIELDYSIRDRGPFTAVTDLLFVRRAQADSLRRTLAAFGELLPGSPG